MIVSFACSGITGLDLFHLVFGIVAIVEWNRLCKARALICYIVGSVVYVLTNFCRLVVLFLLGNLVSKRLNLDFLGWALFAITFYVLMKLSYEWMIERSVRRPALGACEEARIPEGFPSPR